MVGCSLPDLCDQVYCSLESSRVVVCNLNTDPSACAAVPDASSSAAVQAALDTMLADTGCAETKSSSALFVGAPITFAVVMTLTAVFAVAN
eukprot:SAG31_NODE_13770_length_848_cov_0.906542_1_plen_91_part_00